MPIRNIILDYGGVIIDLDYNKTQEAFIKLGVTNFQALFAQAQQTDLFNQLDKGKISDSTFRNEIRRLYNHPLTDAQIDHAWNSMLSGIREEKLELLKKLHPQYKLFLLSNTNFIHIKAITQYLIRTYGMVNPDRYFEKVYYSCALGMRKPDEEIFRKVIDDNNLVLSETLYVDDSTQHIEGGKKVGLNAVLYNPKDSLEEFLQQYILLQ